MADKNALERAFFSIPSPSSLLPLFFAFGLSEILVQTETEMRKPILSKTATRELIGKRWLILVNIFSRIV